HDALPISRSARAPGGHRSGTAAPARAAGWPSSRGAFQRDSSSHSCSIAYLLPIVHIDKGGRGSPSCGWSVGGPAVVEPARLFRPVTLRPHLSVGLPLSCPGSAVRFSSTGLLQAEGRKSIG